jgi:hypothetical protein
MFIFFSFFLDVSGEDPIKNVIIDKNKYVFRSNLREITLEKKDRERLQNITIALPEIYVENLSKLQEAGFINSRSEGIRSAIKEFLAKEIENARILGYKFPELSD